MLPVAQNIEAASRFEKARGAARAHQARERGNLHLAEEAFAEGNRGRPQQCATDQPTESTYRREPKEAPAGRPGDVRPFPRKRSERLIRYGSSQRAAKRRTARGGQSPRSLSQNQKLSPPKRDVKEEGSDSKERIRNPFRPTENGIAS